MMSAGEGAGAFRRGVLRLLTALLAVGLLFTACSGADDPEAPLDTGASPTTDDVGGPLPSWLTSVTPAPGAVYAPDEGVQVSFDPPPPGTEIRLILDGVDVTSSAQLGPGSLRYDESQVGPVTLDVGEHTAEAQLVQLEADEVDFVVEDSYTWEFRVG